MKFRLLLFVFLVASGSSHSLAADYAQTVLADKPVLYWQFDEASAEKTDDEAGLANGRFVANGPGRRGVSGLAAAFDRAHLAGRVEAKLTAEQDKKLERVLNESFSLELWLLDEAAKRDGKINSSLFYKPDPKQFWRNSTWLYRARQDGHYYFRFNSRGDKPAGLRIRNPAGEKAAGDGKWHHIVITVSRAATRGVMTAFLDGKKVDETTFSIDLAIDNSGPLTIGNGVHPNSPWQGLIDEFALYDRALDPETIVRHHAAGRESMKNSMKVTSPLAAREEFFELKVRPLLIEKCADCHSGEPDSESVLAVNSRRALINGGDFGPAIIPGRAEDSLLIHAVKRIHKEVHMPPEKSDALSRDEIAVLARWIDDGANWPGNSAQVAKKSNPHAEKKLTIDPERDWALQPRRVVDPPAAKDSRWAGSAVDRFLERRRVEARLLATSRADRRALIRRATFDLTGLPPSPQDVSEFLADTDEDTVAFAKVVDRLLASRQYGERAGRLWLDVARYADTQGDVGDIPIQTAYLYRNWVIDSLNEDLPFDQFLRAQIAGDILAEESSSHAQARQLNIATGFLALSRRFGNSKKDDIHLTIEDTIDTIGRGVLGLTLRCARCHDHKFDPILNTDYYGLYGIFESTTYPWMGMSNEKSPSDLAPAVPSKESRETAQKYWDLISRYEYQINNHFRPWLKPTLDEFKSVSKKLESASGEERTKHEAQQKELLARYNGRFRELMLKGLAWIRSEKQRIAENPGMEFVFAVAEGKGGNARIHRRGNPRQPGDETPRRFLTAVDGPKPPRIVGGSGRLQLANWLTRPDHPLTARVIVNRVWQQHFGRGLVATPDNFGRQGTKPSHPELLDWLAEQFIRDGWSLKKLHCRVMLSESYQLSSQAEAASFETDPENILISRFDRRRLDAESIRDALLAVSGQLDRSPGGAHPMKPWYRNRFSLNSPFHLEPASNHRSVYLLTQRLFRHSILDQFDGPDRNSSTAKRGSSNIPSQALFLMNSQFVREQAEALAVRLEKETADDEARIKRAFQLAYSRDPEATELNSLTEFLASYREAKATGDGSPELVALSRAILTSNEFFFID